MKKTLMVILAAALVSAAWAGDYEDALDQATFEQWVGRLRVVAPRFGLKLDGNEAEDEFFYLYCWQSTDHSIVHYIKQAKKVWDSESSKTKNQWLQEVGVIAKQEGYDFTGVEDELATLYPKLTPRKAVEQMKGWGYTGGTKSK